MRHLLQAEQIADRIGMTDVRGLGFQADLAEVAILTGELAVAARVVEQLAAASERTGSLMAEVDHLRCRGMLQLANGDIDAAVATLGSAVERARDRVRPMLVARTLLAHGVALRRQGARAHAREHLMEARRAFSQLDSPPWIRRVDDQLERLGARPPVARGSTTLTPTERQIAELVASGRSNREIAAALHISLRTVESNLTRVYRKLAVRGRTELAAGGSDLLDA
jgi:DNA-binding CsgD family transcriptional regulator